MRGTEQCHPAHCVTPILRFLHWSSAEGIVDSISEGFDPHVCAMLTPNILVH